MVFEETETGDSHNFHHSIFPLIFRFVLLVVITLLLLFFYFFVEYQITRTQTVNVIVFRSVFVFVVIGFSTSFLVYLTARWVSDFFTITGKELIVRSGIILIKEDRYSIAEIESLENNQSIIGKALNYGQITVKRPREEPIIILDIPNPKHFIEVIEKNTKLKEGEEKK